jgi:hypothetical protein
MKATMINAAVESHNGNQKKLIPAGARAQPKQAIHHKDV